MVNLPVKAETDHPVGESGWEGGENQSAGSGEPKYIDVGLHLPSLGASGIEAESFSRFPRTDVWEIPRIDPYLWT